VIAYRQLSRPPADELERTELDRVSQMAVQLKAHLESDAVAIAALHLHGAQSTAIQNRVGSLLEQQLGFLSEVVVTPDAGLVTQARPDFYFPLSDNTGVIAEVERGGTTANNHDLKDLGKTHLAVNADHLFLVVPNELFKESGAVREKPYPKVVRRMSAFFGTPRSHVDVLSVHISGC
jgi:hypothetical protein